MKQFQAKAVLWTVRGGSVGLDVASVNAGALGGKRGLNANVSHKEFSWQMNG